MTCVVWWHFGEGCDRASMASCMRHGAMELVGLVVAGGCEWRDVCTENENDSPDAMITDVYSLMMHL